tara:strand:+ start:34 stop:207 length:174 start_codon:yes stop_codon:yes gene_type:complete
MKFLLAIITVLVFVSTSDRSSYNDCMIQAKSDYISEKGAKHVAAQCKAFILEKIMTK